MVETRQYITRRPQSFNCGVKVRINLSFMIRLILEKVELSSGSPSWLRSFVHNTLRRLMIKIHRTGIDPVMAGQFD
jgi:hypothetical protein